MTPMTTTHHPVSQPPCHEPAAEPRWCAHIEHDDVGRDCDWWLLVPFTNIIAVDTAWRCCPVCAATRPTAA